MTDKNLSLEKDNVELEDKLQQSNLRKRKLEDNVTISETEIKRIKLELVSSKEENQKLKRFKEVAKEKETELKKIIERKNNNLNLLLRQIQKLKPDTRE